MSGREGDEGAVLDAITDEEAEAAARRAPTRVGGGLRREADGTATAWRGCAPAADLAGRVRRALPPLSTLRQWEQGARRTGRGGCCCG